jgi:hypothetical protein
MSHDVPPQDIEHARLAVARYWRRFPVGTVHLIVVDPGVGTSRAALAVESDGRFLVGPDNGVLSPALFALDARVVSLPVEPLLPFHGRDVCARRGNTGHWHQPRDARCACHEPVRLRATAHDGNPWIFGGGSATIDRFSGHGRAQRRS